MEHTLWQFFVDHRPGWLVNVAKFMAVVGDETVLLPVTFLVAAVAVVQGRRTLRTLSPVATMVVSYVATGALKTLINRARPPLAERLVEVSTHSMPSGHATYAAAMACLVWLLTADRPNARPARAAAVALAALAGVSRMVLGVHWAGDVLAGWALGAAVAVGVVRVMRTRLQSVA